MQCASLSVRAKGCAASQAAVTHQDLTTALKTGACSAQSVAFLLTAARLVTCGDLSARSACEDIHLFENTVAASRSTDHSGSKADAADSCKNVCHSLGSAWPHLKRPRCASKGLQGQHISFKRHD